MTKKKITRHTDIEVPRPVFLFTLDQIAMSLNCTEGYLVMHYVFFKDLAPAAVPNPDKLTAHNIADIGDTYDWRISEPEYTRWLFRRGFRTRYSQLH